MRTGITLLAGAAVFCCVAAALAQPSESSAADSTPWHLAKVDKRTADRPTKDAEPDDANPRKYLHIQVDFHGQPEAEKKHQFKVVTESGDEVGELYGWSDDNSLVIFEGSWSDLTGLYLDGIGHREPLFQPPPEEKPEPDKEPKIDTSKVVELPEEIKQKDQKAKKDPKKVVAYGKKGSSKGPGKGPGGGSGGGSSTSGGVIPGGGVERKIKDPLLVLYLATGEETEPGIVYQVDEQGLTLGMVKLPFAPTGITLHRNNGLVVALPRDGGKIMRIDAGGMVSTILEKNKNLLHPIDVGIAGDSDTVFVADNISNVLAATTIDGKTPRILRRLDSSKAVDAGVPYAGAGVEMSVAGAKDGFIILGTDGESGVYRYPIQGDSAQVKPLLPLCGGVAADPKSSRWAAAQSPDTINVFQGDAVLKTLQLPSGKSLYLQGRLSFGPGDLLCVAVRKSDATDGKVLFLLYNIETGETRSLFTWNKERLNDFVVGPRMYWDQKEPNGIGVR